MSFIVIDRRRIKVDWYDALIDSFLFLWMPDGVRKVPRNIYSTHKIAMAVFMSIFGLPLFWGLSHIPFIWPQALFIMAITLCFIIGDAPYADYFRALFALILGLGLMHYRVTFDVSFLGYHLEKYLYYIAIATAIFSLWRRFLNFVCWSQIDRICEKYGFPHYDQKILMDNYEGYDTKHGEKVVTYSTYQEAINFDRVVK